MPEKINFRFIFAVLITMLVNYSGCTFAADEEKSLALSRALLQVKLFEGLSEMEIDALKDTAKLRRGKAGERIIEEGTSLDRMFVILDGQAQVVVNGKQILTLSGQSLVGEIEFLDMLPASADIILINESNLIELNNASFSELMEKRPQLGYELILRIARIECQRLRISNQK